MKTHRIPALLAMTISIVAVMAITAVAYAPNDAYAQVQSGGVDQDGSWYAGEGLKQGDYFSYSMCHVDYKECSKFRLDLWLKGDIQTGSETKWLADVVVYDGHNIIKGQMELGKIAPEPTGGTENLGVYRGAFKSSIVWLSAFATADTELEGKGSKEFRDKSWGKIANIGGEQILPIAAENTRVAGQDWETIKVGWRTGGYSSYIWIVDDFPFPVKAKTFTHVSEGIPPVEYEFVLLKYVEDVQDDPFKDVIPTQNIQEALGCDTSFDKDTAVKKSTVGAMYQVHVFYGPADPKQGCNMQWLIKFINKYDETEFLNRVQFDIFTVDENMKPTRSLAGEDGKRFLYSPSGQYLVDVLVNEDPGPVEYVIWVYGLAPDNTIPTDPHDYVNIPITIYENEALDEPAPESAVPPESLTSIPAWIKTNAGWWAEGMIDDGSFVQGIQYLINQKVIQIPPTGVDVNNDSPAGEIPAWIKNNAGWWAEGAIDDSTFVQAIQFLIQNGVMTVSP